MDQQNEEKAVAGESKIFQRLWMILKRTVLYLFILLISLMVIVHIPSVQKFLADKTTSYLSDELGTEVSIGGFYLKFFDELELQDLQIRDLRDSSLLSIGSLRVNFRFLPSILFNKSLSMKSIGLNDATVNLLVDENGSVNARFILDYLTKKEQDPNKEGLRLLAVEDWLLNNVRFKIENQYNGQELDFLIHYGLIGGVSFSPSNKVLLIDRLSLDKLVARISDDTPSALFFKRTDEATEESSDKKFVLQVARINVSNSRLGYDNELQERQPDRSAKSFDFQHLNVGELNFAVDNFSMSDLNFDGKLNGMSFVADNGFKLNSLVADTFSVHNDGAFAHGLELKTDGSYLKDSLVFLYDRYPDFRDFNNNVFVNLRLRESYITLDDIMYFAEPLRRNDFFIANVKEKLNISGDIRGRVNSLSVRNINMNLSDRLLVEGQLDMRNITTPDDAIVNFSLDRFTSDFYTLKRLVPGFSYPANFDKLGRFTFSGNFDGFFDNFVAYGNLTSRIGHANMDMQLNFREGRDRARYSGSLSIQNFDLGIWLDNPDFGKVSFKSDVQEGRGLSIDYLQANLTAEILTFSYKGYGYDNITFDGFMQKDSIGGRIEMDDANLKFLIDGSFSHFTENPVLDFVFDFERINFRELNLSKKNISLQGHGEISMVIPKFEDIDGNFIIRDIVLSRDSISEFIDSIHLYTRNVGSDNQLLALESDILDAELMGLYKLGDIPKIFMSDLVNEFPGISAFLGIREPAASTEFNRFSYSFEVKKTGAIPLMFGIERFEVDSMYILGTLVGGGGTPVSFSLEGATENLFIGSARFSKLRFGVNSISGDWKLNVRTTGFKTGNAMWYNGIADVTAGKDHIEFTMTSDSIGNEIKNFLIRGNVEATDSSLVLQFLPSKFQLVDDLWTLTRSNRVEYGRDFLKVENVYFETRGGRRIILNSIDEFGMSAEIRGLNLGLLNQFIDEGRYKFAGRTDANINTRNIKTLEALNGNIKVDNFYFNDIYVGEFAVRAVASGIREPIHLTSSIIRGESAIRIGGKLHTPVTSEEKMTVDVTAEFDKYPLIIAEAFIRNGISQTAGFLNGNVNLKGPFSKLEIDGYADIMEGKVRIDYLGTTYYSSGYRVGIGNEIFDLSRLVLRDELNNSANISGGIRHERFRNFTLDCAINSDEFLLLNTTKEENPLYYGRGYGKARVAFSGNFQNTNIDIEATTKNSTKLSIPLYAGADASEVDFITFTNATAEEEQDSMPLIRSIPIGLSLRMDLRVTNEAQVWLIFDERTGDIIKGNGSGDIILNITREGDFEMFGEYIISQGEYLFTLMNFVNKPFTILQGGSVQWSGDPINANINIQAEYKGLRTPVYNFIADLIEGRPNMASVISDARLATDVQLIMNLTGALLNPQISFKLGFPQLESQLRTVVQNKLREVESDENELNRQVLGLIVFNNFFSSGFSGQDNTQLGINTMSGFLSAQISSYLSDVLSQALTGVDFISGIDLDVGYNRFMGEKIEGNNTFLSGEEFNVRLKNTLFDDRLAINAGANIVTNNEITGGYYIAGDVAVEYYLTEARRLKVKFYNRNDQTVYGPRQRTGIGLSFRKEFNTIDELFTNMRRDVIKAGEDL